MTLASEAMEEIVYQTISSTHGPHGKFFFVAMVSHNAALQIAALSNKSTLKELFPN